MKDIMTAKTYCDTEFSHIYATRDKDEIQNAMEAYAHYYCKALIKSLGDEEINNKYPRVPVKRFSDVPLEENREANNRIFGAKWAREELLKRNEG